MANRPSDKKMKVLFVIEYYIPHIGGVEIVFKNLCEGLAARGHDITVVTLRTGNTPSFEVINGVKVSRVKTPARGDRYWFSFFAIPEVLRIAHQADLVHTTTYNGAFPAWLGGKLWKKPCLITVHELFGSQWKNLVGMSRFKSGLHQLLEHIIATLPFHRYITVSRYTADCLAGFGIKQEKIKVIYNGIDYNLFNPEKADGVAIRQKHKLGNTFIYMYYGRPGISKGVEYLVQAVPLIRQSVPGSKLLMVLSNDPRDRYENIRRMIKELNIENDMVLLAPVPRNELPDYIATADCVVIPSLSEGFGFSAAEACAMGRPVIASNVASLPEVVSGRYVLVEPGNSEAIAEAVTRVYKREAENHQSKTFSWHECVEEYLKVYRHFVNSA